MKSFGELLRDEKVCLGQVLSDVKTRVVLSGHQSTRVTIKTMHQNYLEAPYGFAIVKINEDEI